MSTLRTGRKKTRVGVVVSARMQKTVAVEVARRLLEPRFHKYISRRKKYLAHDEKKECRVGDVVAIVETRPLSRRKSWRVSAILRKGTGEVL